MIVEYLGNGSSGNSTYVDNGATSILIDMGIAVKRTKPVNGGILISHDHIDHCGTVNRYMRKYGKSGIRTIVSSAFYPGTFVEEQYITRVNFFKERPFFIKTMEVLACGLWHDTPNFFFILDKKYLHLTDTGKIPITFLYQIQQNPIEVIYLESNYDEELMELSEYDEFLKYRIKSRIGHLSNQTVLSFLTKNEKSLTKVKHIVLGHLSEVTNTVEKLTELISNLPESLRTKIIIGTEGMRLEF